MDSVSYTVALLDIRANSDELYLTDHYTELPAGANIYLSCPSMEFDLPEQVGDFTSTEGSIKNLQDIFPIVAQIAAGYPYNKIEITVTEAVLDDSFSVVSSNVLFDGLLYTSERQIASGYVNFIIRNWKYYTNITGGNPCSENCSVKYFGDDICKASVTTSDVQITDISDDLITVSPAPTGVNFLYNKGYISFNGINIKILHWESGDVIQTKLPVPGDWLGQTITVNSGCDRSLTTCRDIHNNEINFYGLGISMVDYNPLTERA
jgi:hypothetical protein